MLIKTRIVRKLHCVIEKGWIYFVREDGSIARVKEIQDHGKRMKIEIVSHSKVKKKEDCVYFIDRKGNVKELCLLK